MVHVGKFLYTYTLYINVVSSIVSIVVASSVAHKALKMWNVPSASMSMSALPLCFLQLCISLDTTAFTVVKLDSEACHIQTTHKTH